MRVGYMCPCGRSSACLCELRTPLVKPDGELAGVERCPYCHGTHDEAVFAEQGCPDMEGPQ